MSELVDEPEVKKKGGPGWPQMRAVMRQRQLERHAEQRWRPGCARCGGMARTPLSPDGARVWHEKHECP